MYSRDSPLYASNDFGIRDATPAKARYLPIMCIDGIGKMLPFGMRCLQGVSRPKTVIHAQRSG